MNFNEIVYLSSMHLQKAIRTHGLPLGHKENFVLIECLLKMRQTNKSHMENRYIATVRDKLVEGVHISHVLQVQFFNPPKEPGAFDAIRKYIKDRVWNRVHKSSLTAGDITYSIEIRWEMPGADDTCDYFYAIDLPYTDVVVDNHAREMLQRIHASLRAAHPELGTGWSLMYLITHPAKRCVHSLVVDEADEE